MISWVIFVVLQAVALMHLSWAFGIVWPAKSEAELVRTVIGSPTHEKMPPMGLTIVVAICISALGVLAIWEGPIFGLRGILLTGAAVIFAIRGVATYLPFGPLNSAVQPFRTLDRFIFAPLCFGLAAGYAIIILNS